MFSASVLDKERTIAQRGFNRWLIPPAALAIHLCIGQVYAFSVFNLPMTKLIGITQSAPNDWNIPTLGWIFSSAIAFLGISASVFGKWVERERPRKAMFVAALCFSGGFFVSAVGIYLHQIALIYLGYGVLGGIGLGIGKSLSCSSSSLEELPSISPPYNQFHMDFLIPFHEISDTNDLSSFLSPAH